MEAIYESRSLKKLFVIAVHILFVVIAEQTAPHNQCFAKSEH